MIEAISPVTTPTGLTTMALMAGYLGYLALRQFLSTLC
jgi:hypothetical protein